MESEYKFILYTEYELFHMSEDKKNKHCELDPWWNYFQKKDKDEEYKIYIIHNVPLTDISHSIIHLYDNDLSLLGLEDILNKFKVYNLEFRTYINLWFFREKDYLTHEIDFPIYDILWNEVSMLSEKQQNLNVWNLWILSEEKHEVDNIEIHRQSLCNFLKWIKIAIIEIDEQREFNKIDTVWNRESYWIEKQKMRHQLYLEYIETKIETKQSAITQASESQEKKTTSINSDEVPIVQHKINDTKLLKKKINSSSATLTANQQYQNEQNLLLKKRQLQGEWNSNNPPTSFETIQNFPPEKGPDPWNEQRENYITKNLKKQTKQNSSRCSNRLSIQQYNNTCDSTSSINNNISSSSSSSSSSSLSNKDVKKRKFDDNNERDKIENILSSSSTILPNVEMSAVQMDAEEEEPWSWQEYNPLMYEETYHRAGDLTKVQLIQKISDNVVDFKRQLKHQAESMSQGIAPDQAAAHNQELHNVIENIRSLTKTQLNKMKKAQLIDIMADNEAEFKKQLKKHSESMAQVKAPDQTSAQNQSMQIEIGELQQQNNNTDDNLQIVAVFTTNSDANISVVDDHVDVTNDICIDNVLADITAADDNLFDFESVEIPEEIVCNATDNNDVNSVVYIPPPPVVAIVKTEPQLRIICSTVEESKRVRLECKKMLNEMKRKKK